MTALDTFRAQLNTSDLEKLLQFEERVRDELPASEIQRLLTAFRVVEADMHAKGVMRKRQGLSSAREFGLSKFYYRAGRICEEELAKRGIR